MLSCAPSLEEIQNHADIMLETIRSDKSSFRTVGDLEDYYNMVYKLENPCDVSFRDVFGLLVKKRLIRVASNKYIYLIKEKETLSENHSLTESSNAKNCSTYQFNKMCVQTKSRIICPQCKDLSFETEEELYEHKTTKAHFVEFLKFWLERNKRDLIEDKLGITITTVERNLNQKINIQKNERVEFIFCIKNKGTGGQSGRVHFRFCQLLHNLKYVTLSDKHDITRGGKSFLIPPGTQYQIKFEALSPDIGEWSVPVAFQFCLEEEYEPFHIIRCVVLSCSDDIVSSLQPMKEYIKLDVVSKPPAHTIIDGVLLSKNKSLDRLIKERQLFPVQIPDTLYDLVDNSFQPWENMTSQQSASLKKLKLLMDNPLSYETYCQFFQAMLHIEFIQLERDIRNFDMDAVPADTEGRKLVIEVPGLEEGRPSVLQGDRVYLALHDENKKCKDIEYEGIVHEVQSSKVFLGVSDDLLEKFIPRMKFDVRFSFNTLPHKFMHRSLQLAEDTNLWSLLFPAIETSAMALPLVDVNDIIFFNRKVENNPEQATAVQHIVAGLSRPSPYLLFGPPGTGKTVTLVEAIKQVWKMLPESRILICTPSNSAADLVTERLIDHVPKREILRIYSVTRPAQKIPTDIKKCSNYLDKVGFFYPSKQEIEEKYRILICTLITSGRLVSACFEVNFFTHIFIDESGHSLEPETIIPVAGLLQCYKSNDCSEDDENSEKLGGQLILAGDPKQLGPVLRSPLCLKLGVSLLERLMNSDVYQRRKDDMFDNRVLTKLIRNYRSHPAILKLPNELFYDGELKACSTIAENHPLSKWDYLPKRGFPVLFHGVNGQDIREERCPSYFNPHEISTVLDYIYKLLSNRKLNLKAEDIGIVTPYRKQVQKLKIKLQDMYDSITVGSVEELQGQERKVIIISTVRSSPDLLSMDHHHKLGFLANPKRFNVAVTRAKFLLIIVGNPRILSRDKYWKKLLDYCIENNSYRGTPIGPMDEEYLKDLIERFEPFGFKQFKKHKGRKEKMRSRQYISQRTLEEDPPWKRGI